MMALLALLIGPWGTASKRSYFMSARRRRKRVPKTSRWPCRHPLPGLLRCLEMRWRSCWFLGLRRVFWSWKSTECFCFFGCKVLSVFVFLGVKFWVFLFCLGVKFWVFLFCLGVWYFPLASKEPGNHLVTVLLWFLYKKRLGDWGLGVTRNGF